MCSCIRFFRPRTISSTAIFDRSSRDIPRDDNVDEADDDDGDDKDAESDGDDGEAIVSPRGLPIEGDVSITKTIIIVFDCSL